MDAATVLLHHLVGWLVGCSPVAKSVQVPAVRGTRADGRTRGEERARSGISLPVTIKIDQSRRRRGRRATVRNAGRPTGKLDVRSVGRSPVGGGSLPLRDLTRLCSLAVTGQFSPSPPVYLVSSFFVLGRRVVVAGSSNESLPTTGHRGRRGGEWRERNERVRHGHSDHRRRRRRTPSQLEYFCPRRSEVYRRRRRRRVRAKDGRTTKTKFQSRLVLRYCIHNGSGQSTAAVHFPTEGLPFGGNCENDGLRQGHSIRVQIFISCQQNGNNIGNR